jgi:hypothetical protein
MARPALLRGEAEEAEPDGTALGPEPTQTTSRNGHTAAQERDPPISRQTAINSAVNRAAKHKEAWPDW